LEIECGFGKGLNYLNNTFRPKFCVGLDSKEENVIKKIKIKIVNIFLFFIDKEMQNGF